MPAVLRSLQGLLSRIPRSALALAVVTTHLARTVMAQGSAEYERRELKIPMREGEHYRFIEQFRARAQFEGARITTIDGVRADWPDGWGLVRASNTTPALVLRFDADTPQALKRAQDAFRTQLLKLDSSLPLPF